MGVTSRETKIGIAIATAGSWGNGVAIATAVGVGDGHYLRDDVDIQARRQLADSNVATRNFIGSVQVANAEAIAAMLPMYLHYDDAWQNVLFALVLGAGGGTPTQVGTSAVYTNTFEAGTSRPASAFYATIARDKVQHISEVPGAVFHGFEIRVGEMGRIEVDWLFVGNDEIVTSSVNTSAQIAALTFPTQGRRWFFRDCVIRLNPLAAGALSASDALKFTGMKLRFEQPVDRKFSGGSTTIVQPVDDGFPRITLELTFARYDGASKAFFAAHKDGAPFKGDLTFTGPSIDGVTPWGLKFEFPHLVVKSYAARMPAGAQSEPAIQLTAYDTSSAPSGMTGITNPIRVTTTGTAAAGPWPPPEVESPTPADGGEASSATLHWEVTGAIGATTFDVYFGTSDPPPLVSSGQSSQAYTPTTDPETEYFWKVVVHADNGSGIGPVWSFTTPAEDDIVILDKDLTMSEVVNTTVLTAAYSFSVPGGTLSTDRALRVTVIGDVLNNTGAVKSGFVTITYGGSSIGGGAYSNLPSDASRRSLILDAFITAAGATNAQRARGGIAVGGVGSIGAAQPEFSRSHEVENAFAKDSTVAQNLEVTVFNETASPNYSVRIHAVWVEKL